MTKIFWSQSRKQLVAKSVVDITIIAVAVASARALFHNTHSVLIVGLIVWFILAKE